MMTDSSAGGGGARQGGNRSKGSSSGGNRRSSGSASSKGNTGRRGGGGARSGGARSGGGGRGPRDRRQTGPARSASARDGATVPSPASAVVRRDAQLAQADEAAATDNRRRARRLFIAFGAAPAVVVAVIVGVVVAPWAGAVALVVVWAGLSLWRWRTACGQVLRALGAAPSGEADRPRVHNLVEGLCATMGLPQPAVMVVDSPVANATTVGLDQASAVLVVTSSLEGALSVVELEGVLAHELVHIKRLDCTVSTAAVACLAPLAAVGLSRADTVRSLTGRGREFSADLRAVGVVRYPPGLSGALGVLAAAHGDARGWPPGRGATAALTVPLWVDPAVGVDAAVADGDLDDPRVRAAALTQF